MIAISILTLVGLGTLSGMLQSRRMTEGSIYVATATTVAQGYIEQLKNMKFDLLDESVFTELINQGAPDTLTVSPMVADPEVGDSATDVPNVKLIDINNTTSDTTDDLQMTFVVYIDDITDSATGIGDARRIILRWSYTDNSNKNARFVGNTLYAIRSSVPTF